MDTLRALHEEYITSTPVAQLTAPLRKRPWIIAATSSSLSRWCINYTKEQPTLSWGMPSYRDFLGLGAGDSDYLYYDVMVFVDISMSGLCVAKGKSGISKMSPEKMNTEWDEDTDKVTPMMWTGVSIRILSQVVSGSGGVGY